MFSGIFNFHNKPRQTFKLVRPVANRNFICKPRLVFPPSKVGLGRSSRVSLYGISSRGDFPIESFMILVNKFIGKIRIVNRVLFLFLRILK